jgi:two-component system, LuxR family, response regulator FixJ
MQQMHRLSPVRIDLAQSAAADVMRALVKGQMNKQIAFALGISPRTVEIYRANLMSKMQAKTLSHLVRVALIVER